MLQAIEGRSVDSLKTRDGQSAVALFTGSVFHSLAHPSIKQFQIVQKSLDEIFVYLVPDGEIPGPILDQISQAIRDLLDENVVVRFEYRDAAQLLPSGKHRYVVSEVK